jgi:hypothetical protein
MLVNEVLPGFNWGLYVQIFGRLPDVRDESSRVAWEQFYAEKVKARRLKQQIEAFLSETGGQD